MIIDEQIHTGTSFLKTKKFKQNSKLYWYPIFFSNIVPNMKLIKFIKKKISLGDAGSPLFFFSNSSWVVSMNPLNSGRERISHAFSLNHSLGGGGG